MSLSIDRAAGEWAWHCTNPLCRRELGVDHVTLVTTAHVRRFCSVECITESQGETYRAAIYGEVER